jgi:predicted KAP-like P-loop ATPase
MASTDPSLEDDQLGGIAGSAIGDHPTHADRLGFKPYVEAIAGFLLADATRPPITISIEGEWGSGKSSFLLQLEDAIVGERRFGAFLKTLPLWLGGESASGSISAAWKKLRSPRPPLTVRFNAWRHDKQDSVWAAFALAFVQSLRSEIGFVRAYLGDLGLFLKRLTGFRGCSSSSCSPSPRYY